MVLCLVLVLFVRIRRITLIQVPYTSTIFVSVSYPAIIVGPRGVIMKDNEEEEDDDNYPEFPKYGGISMGRMKKRHQTSLLMILVRSLLMHRETAKMKRRD
jgi:hypothetical protein